MELENIGLELVVGMVRVTIALMQVLLVGLVVQVMVYARGQILESPYLQINITMSRRILLDLWNLDLQINHIQTQNVTT